MRTSTLTDPATGRSSRLSQLGLGCSQVGSFGNPTSPADIRALMRHALDAGVNVFDTADIYGQGDSEREIGRVLQGRRDEAFVITKFGKGFSTAMRLARPFKPILKPLLAMRGRSSGGGAIVTAQRERNMREDFSSEHLVQALEGSLRRLRMDAVDAVMLHSAPAAVLRDPRVAETLAALKAAGKALHFGASLDHWEELEPALAIPGLTVLQLPIDIIQQAEASNLAREIADRGVAIFAREVIRLQPALTPVQAVKSAAGRPGVACVIVGTSRPAHLDQLIQACA